MACAIEKCDSTPKFTLKFWRKFKTLALAISFGSLGWQICNAYSQTAPIVTRQEPPPGAIRKLRAFSVSPAWGSRVTRATRSTLIEPKTMIIGACSAGQSRSQFSSNSLPHLAFACSLSLAPVRCVESMQDDSLKWKIARPLHGE